MFDLFLSAAAKHQNQHDQACDLLRAGQHRVMLRVESVLGVPGKRLGAYRSGAADRLLGEDCDGGGSVGDRHPSPWQDAGLAPEWEYLTEQETALKYLFGFDKFSQYKNWFFKEDRLEAEQGTSVLGVYIVPRELSTVGQFQMIAKQTGMMYLKDLPLTYKMDYQLQELFAAQEQSDAG